MTCFVYLDVNNGKVHTRSKQLKENATTFFNTPCFSM